MVHLPQIVYLQTNTECNGHCRYCPHDDIYGFQEPHEMPMEMFVNIIQWLKAQQYKGRIGFLLHYEPTLDENLGFKLGYAKQELPYCKMEVATNGIIDEPALHFFDVVDRIDAGSRKEATSRAGNVRECPEIMGRARLAQPPCNVPVDTMPIAANGDVLLCCQDWRHEAVMGTAEDLTAARIRQLHFAKKAKKLELEICRDCMAGKTAEEVGERLGRR